MAQVEEPVLFPLPLIGIVYGDSCSWLSMEEAKDWMVKAWAVGVSTPPSTRDNVEAATMMMANQECR